MRKDKFLKKTILCIGTVDSKAEEIKCIRDLIEKRGHIPLLMDVGSLGKAPFTLDITSEEVANAAGGKIEEVRSLKEAGPAAKIMSEGAKIIAKDMYDAGRFQGVIGIGGGMGSAIVSAVMRELPIGVPKFMLCSQKIVQAGIRGYVGIKDISVMPSVADIAGLNRLTRKALSNAVGAVVGMVESPDIEETEKPLVFITTLGRPKSCGTKVKSMLEEKGFEVAVFHTVGIGGRTCEELVKSYPVVGVIELGLNEIGNELLGGTCSAGPDRLEAAGERGIPQIVTPGFADLINFLGPETLPDKYRHRNIVVHNPQSTVMRVNAEEAKMIGEVIADKLNKAAGPVKFLLPTRGFSHFDRSGDVFFDTVADKAFTDALKGAMKEDIEIREVYAHIDDDEFAKIVLHEFLNILGKN